MQISVAPSSGTEEGAPAVAAERAEVLASLTSPRPITLNVGVGAYSDALIRVGDQYQVRAAHSGRA